MLAEQQKRRLRENLVYHELFEGEYETKEALSQMQQCCAEILQQMYYQKFIKSELFEKVKKTHKKPKQISTTTTKEDKVAVETTSPVEDEGFDEKNTN